MRKFLNLEDEVLTIYDEIRRSKEQEVEPKTDIVSKIAAGL